MLQRLILPKVRAVLLLLLRRSAWTATHAVADDDAVAGEAQVAVRGARGRFGCKVLQPRLDCAHAEGGGQAPREAGLGLP